MLRLTLLGILAASFAAVSAGCSKSAGPSTGVEPKVDKSATRTSSPSKSDEGAAEGEAKTNIPAATPEQALRTFLIAMMTRDEATLRAVTLPTEDFEWLLRGQVVPADHLAKVKAQVARQPIRALKPGDEITLPGNRKTIVQANAVTAEKALLWPESHPLPYSIQKIDGQWRVDAGPVIAVRKAADAALKKKQPK